VGTVIVLWCLLVVTLGPPRWRRLVAEETAAPWRGWASTRSYAATMHHFCHGTPAMSRIARPNFDEAVMPALRSPACRNPHCGQTTPD
jgi:hypothetical protein